MFRFFLFTALLMFASAVQAQRPAPDSGAHVRVRDVTGVVTTGRLLQWATDTIRISADRDGRTVAIPRRSVLEVQLGRTVRGGRAVARMAAAGLFVGGVGGALVGPLVMRNSCQFEYDMGNMLDCGIALLDGDQRRDAAVVGALGGAAIGALAGTLSRSERWETVPLDMPAQPAAPPVASAGGV